MYKITERDVEDFLNKYKTEFKKKLKKNNKDIYSFKVIEYKTNYDYSEFRIITNRDIKIKVDLIKFVLAIEHFNSVYEESGNYYDEDIANCSAFWAAFLAGKNPDLKKEVLKAIEDKKSAIEDKDYAKIFNMEEEVNKLRIKLGDKLNYYRKMEDLVNRGLNTDSNID